MTRDLDGAEVTDPIVGPLITRLLGRDLEEGDELRGEYRLRVDRLIPHAHRPRTRWAVEEATGRRVAIHDLAACLITTRDTP